MIRKKHITVCLFLLLVSAMAFGQLLGDANEDRQVDIVDALQIAQHQVGILLPSMINIVNADVDGNGTINIVDALMVAQYCVGVITQFPAEPVPRAIVNFYQQMVDGAWQNDWTDLSLSTSTTAGIFTIKIQPQAGITFPLLPGDFIGARIGMGLDPDGAAIVLPEYLKPEYMPYRDIDGAVFIEGLRLLLEEPEINARVLDYMWRVELSVQSINDPGDVYIRWSNTVYRATRDTDGAVVCTQHPHTNYLDFEEGIRAGLDPAVMVIGMTRPELIMPPFYQINLLSAGSLPDTNLTDLEIWITGDNRTTKIFFNHLEARYNGQLITDSAWLYAGLVLWHKAAGRQLQYIYEPVVLMARITMLENYSSHLNFVDPDGIAWQVSWNNTSVYLMQI